MNNFVLLGLGVVVLFFVMNGSKGKGKSNSMSGSLSKSVSKALEGNGALILLAVGAVVLFMCMNKGLVEGTGAGEGEHEQILRITGVIEDWCEKNYPTMETKCAPCLTLVLDSNEELRHNFSPKTPKNKVDFVNGFVEGKLTSDKCSEKDQKNLMNMKAANAQSK